MSTISGIPDLILSGIKAIFVPDEETLQASFDKVTAKCNNLLVYYDLERLFKTETDIADVTVTIYGKKAVVVDSSVTQTGINHFRPYIRGFLVLMLVFFNVNQFLSLIGANPISAIGAYQQFANKKGGGNE